MSVHKKSFRSIVLVLCALPLAALAGPRYSVHVLGSAGSSANDINNIGQVVGQYTNGGGELRAFLHAGVAALDVGTLGGAGASAAAINDSGQVVGYASNADGYSRAFSYAGGVMTDLGSLGGNTSRAYGLNNAGHVVGSADYPAGTVGEYGIAFSYADGSMLGLGYLPTHEFDERSRGLAVNSLGHIVGASSATDFGAPEHPEHAFLYSDGTMVDLGTLGGLYSAARSINEGGMIVGQASTTLDPDNIGHTIPHAFLYVGGVMVDLGALGDALSLSDARDVNNLGQVVGSFGYAGSDGQRAFLYEGGSLLDITGFLDPFSGWVVTEAAAINDLQQIAGTACRDGQCYAVRLDLEQVAVSEPGMWMLMAAGLAVLAWRSPRRRNRQFSPW
jgi:probable HAF family extracellular repeat protein